MLQKTRKLAKKLWQIWCSKLEVIHQICQGFSPPKFFTVQYIHVCFIAMKSFFLCILINTFHRLKLGHFTAACAFISACIVAQSLILASLSL